MEINGKQIEPAIIEQLRTLAEVIREKKANAIGHMRETVEAMHMQGKLLVQAELQLGDAFDAFVEQLGDHGMDPNQARANHRLAKKCPKFDDLLDNPGALKQLTLQNFAPSVPPKETGEKSVPAFVLTYHLNSEPVAWSAELRAEFLGKARPVVELARELAGK